MHGWGGGCAPSVCVCGAAARDAAAWPLCACVYARARAVRAGSSVCCHIHGFQPYFFAAMPPTFAPDDVEAFRKALNVRTHARSVAHLFASCARGLRTQQLRSFVAILPACPPAHA
jgi:hypothetical protein